jgi:hypothetical protein
LCENLYELTNNKIKKVKEISKKSSKDDDDIEINLDNEEEFLFDKLIENIDAIKELEYVASPILKISLPSTSKILSFFS